MQSIPDGDGTLLDGTVVLFGSGMSDGNVHNNYNVPVVVVGGPERGLQGDRHLVYPQGTPLANLSLSLMAKFGVHVSDSATARDSFRCCRACRDVADA